MLGWTDGVEGSESSKGRSQISAGPTSRSRTLWTVATSFHILSQKSRSLMICERTRKGKRDSWAFRRAYVQTSFRRSSSRRRKTTVRKLWTTKRLVDMLRRDRKRERKEREGERMQRGRGWDVSVRVRNQFQRRTNRAFCPYPAHTSQRPEIAPGKRAVPSLRALERVETSEAEPILLRGREGWWIGGISSLLREEPIRSKMLVSAKDEGVCKESSLLSNGRLGEAED